MLQTLLFVLDAIRILAAAVLIVIMLVMGALGVLMLVAEIERHIRRLRHKLAMRKMRKKIEKLFRENHDRIMMPYIEADIRLTETLYDFKTNQQDNETLNRATEYHHGISD